jgi:hypothetical protein
MVRSEYVAYVPGLPLDAAKIGKTVTDQRLNEGISYP